MADSIRKIWLAALLAKMQAEFPTAMFTIPSYVPDELPACTVWDDTEDATLDDYGDQSMNTSVAIEAHEEVTPAVGTVAAQMSALNAQGQALLARIIKAATADPTIAGTCESIQYSAGAVQYPDDGQSVLSAGITCNVRWRHKRGDPYTAGA